MFECWERLVIHQSKCFFGSKWYFFWSNLIKKNSMIFFDWSIRKFSFCLIEFLLWWITSRSLILDNNHIFTVMSHIKNYIQVSQDLMNFKIVFSHNFLFVFLRLSEVLKWLIDIPLVVYTFWIIKKRKYKSEFMLRMF